MTRARAWASARTPPYATGNDGQREADGQCGRHCGGDVLLPLASPGLAFPYMDYGGWRFYNIPLTKQNPLPAPTMRATAGISNSTLPGGGRTRMITVLLIPISKGSKSIVPG